MNRAQFFIIILLSFATMTHDSRCMEPQHPITGLMLLPGLDLIGNILLGTISALALFDFSEKFPLFADLPQDIQNYIIQLIIAGSTSQTLEEAALAIRALTQVNKNLNTLINGPDYSLKLVKHLTEKFNSTEEEVCQALSTKAAKKYLITNFPLINTPPEYLDTKEHHLQYLQATIDNGADINFRFNQDNGGSRLTGLLYRASTRLEGINDRKYLFNFLLNQPNIDINLPNKDGDSALILTIKSSRPDNLFLLDNLLKRSDVNINQQNKKGDSALAIALQLSNATPEISQRRLLLLIAKKLLNAGADPRLPNIYGLTPRDLARYTRDEMIIKSIEAAIVKKHTVK